ncbi:transient receptor potential cation channel subfamily A member 1-like [Dendronephthya gigantea]|uniref:transient receptor potential cation channel subfamily A member 1-like n=1 Tax=Dendronephthya gigantea TaxID=151771 RepID=UPI0010696566|nr:transient receptor potential cation channel subfamily A member 1-like [Dendronephthya gigantea]XP_028391798.1 transient receptor potential cation channel subfamily A member 1-like [Dendronephthya gigantea]XP_028391799.1 transient receptor potential cation channel subfamily A member 1-like [Dendronephthya gigantea]
MEESTNGVNSSDEDDLSGNGHTVSNPEKKQNDGGEAESIPRLEKPILSGAAKKKEESPSPVQNRSWRHKLDPAKMLFAAERIEDERPFTIQKPMFPYRKESIEETAEEHIPLIEKKKKKASKSEIVQKKFAGPPSKLENSLQKVIVYSEDSSKIALIRKAEEKFFTSGTSGEEVDKKIVLRYCDIATAIYLDNDIHLIGFISKGPRHHAEIQRRILEAVEFNSLKCLRLLCDYYSPITTEEDIHLFHRRYGLSSWPLNERPKESALHLVAKKATSIEAMKVFEQVPKFLEDFSDIPDSHGSSPLLLAIKCNNMEVVKRLLTRKPDLNKRNKLNETPILVAALNDDADVIKEMLAIYSETELLEVIKNIDGKGHSILYPASQSGKPKVLNLIMKQSCWREFLDQERKMTEHWESFVCNVCQTGCKELAKTIFEQNPELLEASGEKVTPLMRAAEANQWEIVKLIFEFKPDHSILKTCDRRGRNVFHYSVENPDILRYLIEEAKKGNSMNTVPAKMDNSENTPIKLAAVRKLEESFKILLESTTSEGDIFSAHLIHNVDFQVLKKGLLSWREKNPETLACLLKGDYKEDQPFLEAAKKGNIQLLEFFLEEGANYLQRAPNDQTAIHFAVLSGKLAAVEFLLKRKEFLEMINFTDDVNISAAGYATQSGNAEILRCLLENGAKMKSDSKTARLNILDCAYGYFKTGENSLKEIVRFCTKNGKIQSLQELFEDSYFGADCITSKLIEKTPDVAMMIFDLCVYQDEYLTHRSYGEVEIERRVSYSFFPFKQNNPKDKVDGKLEAIESMVNTKRDNCLGHPLVLRFLSEKLNSSRIQEWLFFNILLYATFLFTLTAYGTMASQGSHNLNAPGMIALSLIILVFCALHFIKEILQFALSTANYIRDFENYIEWVIFICAVIYVVPGSSKKTEMQIEAGAISVFLGWINFSLFLKRFSLFGIYIIMAKRVFLTVCKVLPLVLLFIVAFSLSFSLLIPVDQGFKNIPVSILTTFVMMTGELDYRDIFLASRPLHVLQKILLVLFILMISIAVMNLLTGLAVDDINDIMTRSKEEKRIFKAKLVITLERNLRNVPFFSLPKNLDGLEDFPDRKSQSSWLLRQWKKVFEDSDEVEEQLKAMAGKNGGNCNKQFDELRDEIRKTNKVIQSKFEKIEAMFEKIQAGGIRASAVEPH